MNEEKRSNINQNELSNFPFDQLYNDKEKYTWNFSNNFSKGLFQYLAGNFNGALDYLRIAKVLAPKDKATLVLLERCRKFVKEHPAHWDGSITLTTK